MESEVVVKNVGDAPVLVWYEDDPATKVEILAGQERVFDGSRSLWAVGKDGSEAEIAACYEK